MPQSKLFRRTTADRSTVTSPSRTVAQRSGKQVAPPSYITPNRALGISGWPQVTARQLILRYADRGHAWRSWLLRRSVSQVRR
jgi:hypothetical protein